MIFSIRTSVALVGGFALAVTLGAGCAAYVTPGRGAGLEAFGVQRAGGRSELTAAREAQSDGSVSRTLNKRPLASFPAAVAVARVQAPGYRSYTAQGFGAGRYSIVTTRDIERPEQIARLSKLPMVSGIAPINRLLLPPELNSDLELRQAAAQLHADMLLVYTLDTRFVVEDKVAPLTVVSLGLSPNQQVRVVSTASAVLMDTRNGYVYGVAEATDQGTRPTSAWTRRDAVDEARRRAETAAFGKLVDELEGVWTGVVATYGGGGGGGKPVVTAEPG